MYSIEKIAEVLAAEESIIKNNAQISYLITDSRRIVFPAISLFFALHINKRDGHDFIKEVYEQGVRSFVVEKSFNTKNFADANFLFAENTLLALQQLAVYHRSQFHYPVIGITGSNGKTIVKEWLYQLLSPEYNIVRSPRSYNSQIGVPLSVWQMSAANSLAIFEAGISQTNEMQSLQKIIQPTLGVLTNIGNAHDEGFTNNYEKAAEKLKLFESCEVMFCNAESEFIKKSLPVKQAYKVIDWGNNADAVLQIKNIEKIEGSTVIKALHEKQELSITIPFTDEASIQNAVTCWNVLLYLKYDAQTIATRMLQLSAIEMRLELVQAVNDCAVINDSYSFDITSLNIALDFLLQQQQQFKKTVIISDLPTAFNEASYNEVAHLLSAKNIDRVIAIGNTWQTIKNLLDDKFQSTEYYNNTEDFLQHFNTNHFRNEAILLKGARVFAFEKIAALLEKKVHQTVMEINLTALVHNLKQYQLNLKPDVKLMAMVKAFGYGSGSAEVAHVLQYHKVDYLAVAYADEGVELRNAGIRLPIMIMNVDEAAFEILVQYNLEPELFSENIFTRFNRFLQKQGLQQYPVHVKIDSGMHRLGFEEKDMDMLAALLYNNQNIVIKSVFSHLAASDNALEDAFTMQQLQVFQRCCDAITKMIDYAFIKHIANSAAIFKSKEMQRDMVRLGIGLYGVDSSHEHKLDLKPVATLKTTIAQLRFVKAGDTVGYNRKGRVLKDSIIATIRIGYADGFSRQLSNGKGYVFINGSVAPVIGSVCMDMTMIDVTNIPELHEGDEVEIFGNNIPVTDVAKQADTIAYEILTGISQRVKRIYIEE